MITNLLQECRFKKFHIVSTNSIQSIAYAGSSNIPRLPIIMPVASQWFVFWIVKGDREERRKIKNGVNFIGLKHWASQQKMFHLFIFFILKIFLIVLTVMKYCCCKEAFTLTVTLSSGKKRSRKQLALAPQLRLQQSYPLPV